MVYLTLQISPWSAQRAFRKAAHFMPNANPIDGAAQPDTDAGFRQRPHGHDSAKDAPSPSTPSEGPAVGSAAWSDPGAAPELAGNKPAGGVDASHPHLFHLAEAPANVFDGGGLQGGHEHNWPILKGQQGACYIARLAPGGIREPHCHPYAWEMNFVLQGRVRWTVVGPNSAQDGPFEATKGDMIFARARWATFAPSRSLFRQLIPSHLS